MYFILFDLLTMYNFVSILLLCAYTLRATLCMSCWKEIITLESQNYINLYAQNQTASGKFIF